MGEEEKKMEEKKAEEVKEQPKAEEKKEEKKTEPPPPPPPPQEIVLGVYMHCEGCARKVRRCLKGFEGVEDVQTDCKIHKVVVKGEKADPLKVLERVQRKSHRKVDLISPIPKPPADAAKKQEEKEAPKPEVKKEEPKVITVILKVHMHCEACAQEIKKRIQRMNGVENAEPDLKSSQVTVKGVFDPPTLVEYVHKRTGKHAVIVKQEPAKKEEDKGKDGKEEKKVEAEVKKDEQAAKPEAKVAPPPAPAVVAAEETTAVEVKTNEFQYYYHEYPPQQHYQIHPQMIATEIYNPYPPQMFSDENPNACSVM